MSLFRRRRAEDESGSGARILIVGLGNPGDRYAGTRHNVGSEVVGELSRRWNLRRARQKFGGLISEGRASPGGARVVAFLPQTFMNESGRSVGPLRGSLKVPVDRIVVVHDEIDLPFGEIQSRLGGGLAGHNGLKSLKEGLGGADFWRIRVGVGRPDSTEPEVVASYVLSRFRESPDEVRQLIGDAADEAERLVRTMSDEPQHMPDSGKPSSGLARDG